MQTGTFLQSVEGAGKYFSEDDNDYRYYLQDPGYWYGNLAATLSLSGTIEQKEHFTNILDGRDPHTGVPLAVNAGEESRCPGADITYSAPKSVSILAFKDPRIQDIAFKAALHKTLDWVQEEFVQTRHKKAGEMTYEKTGTATFAIFVHKLSRELDPQLHAHCVMPNLTIDKNGKFMAIHNTILENNLLIGQRFRNDLAIEIQKLGYQIDITDRAKGEFQIRGVGSEIVDDFSKRQKQIQAEFDRLRAIRFCDLPDNQIKDWATERLVASRDRTDYKELLEREIEALRVTESPVYAKWKDAELSVLAAKNTRPKKKNVTKDYVLEHINNTLQPHGQTLDSLVDRAQGEPPSKLSSDTPKSAIRAAIDAEIQHEVAFTREKIIDSAMKQTLGTCTPDEILAEFDRLTKPGGEISYLRTETIPAKGKIPIYSTPALREIEAENINLCRTSKTKIIISPKTADSFIDETDRHLIDKNGYGFTKGQKKALRQIVTSKCQFSAIQGDAGTGKSFSMLYAKQLLEAEGYSVRGLAPTGKAADELHNAAEILDSSTIHKLIAKPEDYELKKGKEILIVDESSMGDTMTITKLLKIAKEYEAKVVFVGDRKQFAAVGPGRFFSDLQDRAKVDVTEMTDVIRQNTAQTKGIVKDMSDGNTDAAFYRLKGYSPAELNKKRAESYQVGQVLIFGSRAATLPRGVTTAEITAVEKSKLTIKYKYQNKDFEIEINPKKTHNEYTVFERDNSYKNCIQTINHDKKALLEAVAGDYLDCYTNNQNALVITATNDDRRSLNAIIRKTLVEQGKVENIGDFDLLETQNVGKFNSANSFKPGQLVKGLAQLKVDNKYEYGEIVSIDQNENTLTIRNTKTNTEFTIKPADYARKPFSVFAQTSTTLGLNERIAFLKNARLTDSNGKMVNVRNGQLATITALDRETGDITVKTDSRKVVKFNLNEYNLLTQAYALSSHKSQGMTVDKIIVHADTSKEISKNSFYVAATRCKYDIAVYTDDADRLQQKIRKGQEKYSTLDVDDVPQDDPRGIAKNDFRNRIYDGDRIMLNSVGEDYINKLNDNSYSEVFAENRRKQEEQAAKEAKERQEKAAAEQAKNEAAAQQKYSGILQLATEAGAKLDNIDEANLDKLAQFHDTYETYDAPDLLKKLKFTFESLKRRQDALLSYWRAGEEGAVATFAYGPKADRHANIYKDEHGYYLCEDRYVFNDRIFNPYDGKDFKKGAKHHYFNNVQEAKDTMNRLAENDNIKKSIKDIDRNLGDCLESAKNKGPDQNNSRSLSRGR